MRCQCAVADLVFQSVPHFGKRLPITVRHEDGVIAKSGSAFAVFSNGSFDDSLKQMFLAVEYQCENGAELCASVFFSFQLLQQLAHIGF